MSLSNTVAIGSRCCNSFVRDYAVIGHGWAAPQQALKYERSRTYRIRHKTSLEKELLGQDFWKADYIPFIAQAGLRMKLQIRYCIVRLRETTEELVRWAVD